MASPKKTPKSPSLLSRLGLPTSYLHEFHTESVDTLSSLDDISLSSSPRGGEVSLNEKSLASTDRRGNSSIDEAGEGGTRGGGGGGPPNDKASPTNETSLASPGRRGNSSIDETGEGVPRGGGGPPIDEASPTRGGGGWKLLWITLMVLFFILLLSSLIAVGNQIIPTSFLGGMLSGIGLTLFALAGIKIRKPPITDASILNHYSDGLSKRVKVGIKLCFIASFYSLCNMIGSRRLAFSFLCSVCGIIICGIKLCFCEDTSGITEEFIFNFFHLILDFAWPKRESGSHQMLGAIIITILALMASVS